MSTEEILIDAELHVGTIGADERGPIHMVALVANKPVKIRGAFLLRGQAVAVDPRCLIADVDTGSVEYDPREYLDKMDGGMRAWMEQNPEWPQVKIDVDRGRAGS
jgi:hypothetical protein